MNIDFLPERIKQHRARRARLVRQGYLLALCIAGLVGMGYLREGRINFAQAELTSLSNRAETIQQQLAIRSALEAQQADLMIVKRIDETLGSRASSVEILSELSRILPACMALTSVNMETMDLRTNKALTLNPAAQANAAANAKGPAVKRIRLFITGVSPTDVDVANFIGQLSASPLFEDVNMGYTRNTLFRNRQAREFQASCYIVR